METIFTSSRNAARRSTGSVYQATPYGTPPLGRQAANVDPLRSYLSTSQHSSSCSGSSSWVLWRDEPNSLYRDPRARRGKLCSALLAVAVLLVVLTVLCIAGLAVYMGALRIDTNKPELVFDGSIRVTSGDDFVPVLGNNSSLLFKEMALKYQNMIDRVYQKSQLRPAYKKCEIERFENGSLVIFFRLYLDRRKIPRSYQNVEELARDILVNEFIAPRTAAFKDIQIDATSIFIKRSLDDTVVTTTEESTTRKTSENRTLEIHNGVLRKAQPANASHSIEYASSSTVPKNDSNSKTNYFENEFEGEIIPVLEGTVVVTKIKETSEQHVLHIHKSEPSSSQPAEISSVIGLKELDNDENEADVIEKYTSNSTLPTELKNTFSSVDDKYYTENSKTNSKIYMKDLGQDPESYNKKQNFKVGDVEDVQITPTNRASVEDMTNITYENEELKHMKIYETDRNSGQKTKEEGIPLIGSSMVHRPEDYTSDPLNFKTNTYNDRYHPQATPGENSGPKNTPGPTQGTSPHYQDPFQNTMKHQTEEPWRPILPYYTKQSPKPEYKHAEDEDIGTGVAEVEVIPPSAIENLDNRYSSRLGQPAHHPSSTNNHGGDYGSFSLGTDLKDMQHNDTVSRVSLHVVNSGGVKGEDVETSVLHTTSGGGIIVRKQQQRPIIPATFPPPHTIPLTYTTSEPPSTRRTISNPFTVPELPILHQFHDVDTILKTSRDEEQNNKMLSAGSSIHDDRHWVELLNVTSSGSSKPHAGSHREPFPIRHHQRPVWGSAISNRRPGNNRLPPADIMSIDSSLTKVHVNKSTRIETKPLQEVITPAPIVTLIPVRSNSGVGRPLRPRPKIPFQVAVQVKNKTDFLDVTLNNKTQDEYISSTQNSKSTVSTLSNDAKQDHILHKSTEKPRPSLNNGLDISNKTMQHYSPEIIVSPTKFISQNLGSLWTEKKNETKAFNKTEINYFKHTTQLPTSELISHSTLPTFKTSYQSTIYEKSSTIVPLVTSAKTTRVPQSTMRILTTTKQPLTTQKSKPTSKITTTSTPPSSPTTMLSYVNPSLHEVTSLNLTTASTPILRSSSTTKATTSPSTSILRNSSTTKATTPSSTPILRSSSTTKATTPPSNPILRSSSTTKATTPSSTPILRSSSTTKATTPSSTPILRSSSTAKATTPSSTPILRSSSTTKATTPLPTTKNKVTTVTSIKSSSTSKFQNITNSSLSIVSKTNHTSPANLIMNLKPNFHINKTATVQIKNVTQIVEGLVKSSNTKQSPVKNGVSTNTSSSQIKTNKTETTTTKQQLFNTSGNYVSSTTFTPTQKHQSVLTASNGSSLKLSMSYTTPSTFQGEFIPVIVIQDSSPELWYRNISTGQNSSKTSSTKDSVVEIVSTIMNKTASNKKPGEQVASTPNNKTENKRKTATQVIVSVANMMTTEKSLITLPEKNKQNTTSPILHSDQKIKESTTSHPVTTQTVILNTDIITSTSIEISFGENLKQTPQNSATASKNITHVPQTNKTFNEDTPVTVSPILMEIITTQKLKETRRQPKMKLMKVYTPFFDNFRLERRKLDGVGDMTVGDDVNADILAKYMTSKFSDVTQQTTFNIADTTETYNYSTDDDLPTTLPISTLDEAETSTGSLLEIIPSFKNDSDDHTEEDVSTKMNIGDSTSQELSMGEVTDSNPFTTEPISLITTYITLNGSMFPNTTQTILPVISVTNETIEIYKNFTISKVTTASNSGQLKVSAEPQESEEMLHLINFSNNTTYNQSKNHTTMTQETMNELSKYANIHTDSSPSQDTKNSIDNEDESRTTEKYVGEKITRIIEAEEKLSTKTIASHSNNNNNNHAGIPILTKIYNKIPQHAIDGGSFGKATTESGKADLVNVTACPSNMSLRCGDGECISVLSRCNQLVDCGDGADEHDCSCADYLRAQFLTRKLCDGVVDCWDFSDENNCEWCSPGQFVCPNSQVCVDQYRLCDGSRDCPYGDDEKQCVTVAQNEATAGDFPYNSEGYLMVRKQGRWGKLCLQNFDNVVARSQSAWEVADLGRAVCKAMTYSDFEQVNRTVDIASSSRADDSHYFELTYASDINSNISQPRSSLLFQETQCNQKEVVHVSCRDLECGVRPQAINQWASSRHSRIVGGGNAAPGSWPWQAALYKEGEFQCGATLIADRWLVSAGHCFYHALDDYWVARLGALRRGSSFPSPYEQLRPVSHIILHPGYVDAGFLNDISLLRLQEPVQFSDFVRPVCLPPPPPSAAIRDGRLCTVVGWGQLFEVGRIFPDTLQEVQLPIISTAECRKRTLFLPLYRVTDNMFCAGFDRGGRDACLGDSGGPLMCQEKDGRWSLYGVTSNGYGCARANRPGVYTKVSNYVLWLQAAMAQQVSSLRDSKTQCKGHRCPLGECLPPTRVCNGFMECSDGSDEKGCW